MAHQHTAAGTGAGPRPSWALETAMALSMTVGRGAAARAVADLAHVGPGDRVLDVGCGPGTAARVAAARGAHVTGADPSHVAVALARAISAARRAAGVTWVEAPAEALPLEDGSVTVAWSLSAVHHWSDRQQGLAELRRVLAPGGRLVLVERLSREGARGHGAHGLTTTQCEALTGELGDAGFVGVGATTRRMGRRTVTVVQAAVPDRS